jgi:sugar O-acyltransferase (sialic acid O-acetyltransferase NeuD family)
MHIIGASGHGKVVIETLKSNNQTISGIWDDNNNILTLSGIKLSGDMGAFKCRKRRPVIIAIGNNRIRRKIAQEVQCEFGQAIHNSSVIASSAKISEGTVIMANVTVNPDVFVGCHAILNTNSSVDHDCLIADYVHISPNVGLAGNVSVGEGTHIGIGANVIQGIKIGKWATIGAGAVIINDVPDYAVVVGNPGKIIKYNYE